MISGGKPVLRLPLTGSALRPWPLGYTVSCLPQKELDVPLPETHMVT